MNIKLAKQDDIREIAIKFAQKVEDKKIIDWDEQYNEFIKDNTPVFYHVTRQKVIVDSRQSYLQLVDNNEVIINITNFLPNDCILTLKYKGYEYYSPANSLVVYYRLLK